MELSPGTNFGLWHFGSSGDCDSSVLLPSLAGVQACKKPEKPSKSAAPQKIEIFLENRQGLCYTDR